MALTEILSREHKVVLEKLDGMEKALETLDISGIDEVLTFMETDLSLHRKKEEEVLFPTLGRHIGVEQGPIACMLSEHATEKGFMVDLRAALTEAKAGGDAGEKIKKAVWGILDLLRAHIEKEDHVLFPLAEETLSAEECSEASGRMAEIGTFCQEETHE